MPKNLENLSPKKYRFGITHQGLSKLNTADSHFLKPTSPLHVHVCFLSTDGTSITGSPTSLAQRSRSNLALSGRGGKRPADGFTPLPYNLPTRKELWACEASPRKRPGAWSLMAYSKRLLIISEIRTEARDFNGSHVLASWRCSIAGNVGTIRTSYG